MASETLSQDKLDVLPPKLRPDVEHLVTEDDTPVDNIFSEKQQRLLTESLYSSWRREGDREDFVALSNVGLFHAIHQPPYVPDMLLSLDVQLPSELWSKPHRSYFVWEYGKAPDVVIEVVSNRKGGEDSEKLAGYADVGVPYYVIFDPERLLSNEPLRAYLRELTTYFRLGESHPAYQDHSQPGVVMAPIWLDSVQLGLCLWQGSFEGHENTWLRWVDALGQLIPTGAERAEQEHQRAEQQRQRAEQERQRAQRLAEQLRRLGAEPEE